MSERRPTRKVSQRVRKALGPHQPQPKTAHFLRLLGRDVPVEIAHITRLIGLSPEEAGVADQ
jgi:hypothetical protein